MTPYQLAMGVGAFGLALLVLAGILSAWFSRPWKLEDRTKYGKPLPVNPRWSNRRMWV